VDGVGNAYLTGLTGSTDFPLVDPWQPAYGGGSFDAFVAKLGLTPQAEIQLLIDDVEELIAAGALNPGQGNALIVKLEAALQQWEHCHAKTAANQLGAFINQVNDYISQGVLTPEQGQPLIEAAQAIIDQLETIPLLPPEGGTLMLSPQIWLTAGPGTFRDAVRLECAAHTPLATEPLYDIGLFFELGANYPDESPAQPQQPYTLTVRYDPANLPAAVHEALVGLYSYREDTWVREPSSSVNVDAHVVTAQPDHFSLWSVLAPEPRSVYLPLILKNTSAPPRSRPGD
jgi:hypothetical protein